MSSAPPRHSGAPPLRARLVSFVRPAPYVFDAAPDAEAPTVERATMARAGVRGSAATLSGSWLKFLVQTLTTLVLAHILTPTDFGVVAMVVAVSGFGELLRDLGLSFAVIQAPVLTREQASTMFWYSTGLGTAVAIVLAALSKPISEFYDQPSVAVIMPVLAASIVVSSLGAQHIALLDRGLGFTRVMISEIIAAAVACALALVLAVGGAGYWSLVALYVTQSGMRTLLAWLNVRWRPGRPGPRSSVSGLVTFGFHQLVSQLLNYFSRNVDNVLVGRFFGSKVLGEYAQAYQLLLMPLQQVNAPLQRVAVPLLSRAVTDRALYREYFQMAIRLMGLLLIPVFCVAAVLSDGLVLILLGPQWAASSVLFRILCLAGVTQSLGYATSWLFISTGQGGRQVIYNLVTRPIVVASFFVGAIWGVRGLALAYSLTSAAIVLPAFSYAMKSTPLRLLDLFTGVKELVIFLPVLCGVAYFTQHGLQSAGLTLGPAFLVAALASAVVYIGLWVGLPSCRHTAVRLLRIMRAPA